MPYEEVTNVPSLLQAGYCVGLVFLTPLGDLVPRRPFLLLLIFLTASLSLGLAATNSFTAFSALSFLTGLFSVRPLASLKPEIRADARSQVTPQIFNPLAADLAPPHRRAQAVSIVVSGLLTGMMFARCVPSLFLKSRKTKPRQPASSQESSLAFRGASRTSTGWLLERSTSPFLLCGPRCPTIPRRRRAATTFKFFGGSSLSLRVRLPSLMPVLGQHGQAHVHSASPRPSLLGRLRLLRHLRLLVYVPSPLLAPPPDFVRRDDPHLPPHRIPLPIQHVRPLLATPPQRALTTCDRVEIGLFGLCGIGSIVAAPYVGKLNDCLLPWVGTLCGLLLQLSIALVSVGAAGVSLGAVIVVCICEFGSERGLERRSLGGVGTDIAQQMQQIGNQTRIYSFRPSPHSSLRRLTFSRRIDPLSRGRLNGCCTFLLLPPFPTNPPLPSLLPHLPHHPTSPPISPSPPQI